MGGTTAKPGSSLDRVAQVLFAVAVLASTGLLLHYKLSLGLVADDLVFLHERGIGGLSTLLEPHGENIVVLQAALYRFIYIVFGFGSAVPFQLISLATYVLSVVALFFWVRERVGDPVAALVTIPVLVLGTGYSDILWAFQVGYSVSVLGGLIALIALDRGGRFSGPVACAGLLVAVTMSSLGLPFMVAAAVLLFLRDGWSFWRRYELIVPAVVFLAWYVGWGRHAGSQRTLENVINSPVYVAESLKSVLMSLTGLHRLSSPLGDILGWLTTVTVAGLTTLSLVRRKSLPPAFLIGVAAGLTFWMLIAFNVGSSGFRAPDTSRYQYPGAVFLIMILTGAFTGARPGYRWLAGLAALAVVSMICSLKPLRDGVEEIDFGAALPKGAMTAFNIAGEKVDPAFGVPVAPFFSRQTIPHDQFAELQRRYGKGGWTLEEIPGRSEFDRLGVDAYLAPALGMEIEAGTAASTDCRVVRLAEGRKEVQAVGPGTISFSPRRSPLTVTAGRFADGTPVDLGRVATGSTGILEIPADLSDEPWRVAVQGQGPIRVCQAG